MAKVNLTLPNLGIDELSDSQVIRKIASYLYIQNEQLRYELTHIDEDNMSSEDGATYQGMTQAQVQKAIEEAAKKTQDIDLSSNTIIINLQRRLDNLGKLQAQDAANITRITQELGNKVSTNTYNAGLSGLRALISGNTNLITTLSNNYSVHKHSITINDTTGAISMGGPTANPSFPNISSTTYFKNAVGGVHVSGMTRGSLKDNTDKETGVKAYAIDVTATLSNQNTNPSNTQSIDVTDAYTLGETNGKSSISIKNIAVSASGDITPSGGTVTQPGTANGKFSDDRSFSKSTTVDVTDAYNKGWLAGYGAAPSYTPVSYAKSGLTRETDQLYLKEGENYYPINSRYKYFYTTGSDSWESLYKQS